jgi:hypothetical protein
VASTSSPNPAYHYIDPDYGWTAACWPADCRSEIRMTSDGGDTWETRAIPERVSVQGFTTPLEGFGWARDPAGGKGSRAVTHDGGITWQEEPAAASPEGGQIFGDIPVDDERAFRVTYDVVAPLQLHILATQDGGAHWVNELDIERGVGVPRTLVAHGRIWLIFTALSAGLDIPGPTNHVVIYRKDLDPVPAPAAALVEAPSHRKPLVVALLAGIALAGALAATGIVKRTLR